MALKRYRQVAAGRRLPVYMRSNRTMLDIGDLHQLSTEDLWSVHDCADSVLKRSSRCNTNSASLLDVKIELASRMLGECRLCERKCGVDRRGGQAGFCGVGSRSSYFFEQILWGEEPPLVPSHEVFLSGCNLRCKYCYSWESLLDPQRGTLLDPNEFAALISSRRTEGAMNLNLIGGEPTVHLPSILASLKLADKPTAIVWNSNFYMSGETMRLLDGMVDLYLGDFRFGNDDCASRIGKVNGYMATAKRNFAAAAQSADLVIRHLVLPGHIECCLRPVAKWVAENMADVPFNLMFQYTPFFEALDDPELCRSLTTDEEAAATEIVASLGLNTRKWKQPLKRYPSAGKIGSGGISTTITIRPDGQIGIMHLHSELLDIVGSLTNGGNPDD